MAHSKKSGFTLIETVIYIALLSTIITTGLVSAFTLFSQNRKAFEVGANQSEGAFVMRKIESILHQTETIIVPNDTLNQSDTLSIDQHDTSSLITIKHNTTNSSVEIWRGANPGFIPLTTRSEVTNLSFRHLKSGTISGLEVELVIGEDTWKKIFYLRK